MSQILNKINGTEDIRKLDIGQLRTLCEEIRSYMIDVCSGNPGHLASSLGAVELIVAVHYVFNTPTDHFILDVGHQAYAHKIICGRREEFRTLRHKSGISGFPKMSESPYDAFGVGHSSTSISAALGYAQAARILGLDEKSIALIGDGALSGGLALEALNNAGGSDVLILLNDNNQSIDKAVGGVHKHLLRITTSRSYNRFKGKVWDFLADTHLRDYLQRRIRSIKSKLVKGPGGDLFESMGLRYFGPIDGNDIEKTVRTLQKLRNIKGPKVLHCITAKGKGYAPAEKDPITWHAPGKFDPLTGERKIQPLAAERYQDVFGQVLCDLASADSRVVGITPAMASGCGMTAFAKLFPERFFDVGIEEEHAVTFSAGLAARGLRPFCNIYSSFSQRAYDEIVHDVALQNLPVVLCFDRAGLVGDDGATHTGAFDMAAYRSIPNCVICAPADELELKQQMYSALHYNGGPYIIRYPRGLAEGRTYRDADFEILTPGKSRCLREGKSLAVIALGPVVNRALEAAEAFGDDVAVYDFRFLKPFDKEQLGQIAASVRNILCIEDGCLKGGLFSEVCEDLQELASDCRVHALGLPDSFVEHASQSQQRAAFGLDKEGISKKIAEILQKDF